MSSQPQIFTLEDLDLKIIHALQIEPRVPWTLLSPVLGVDPVTLSRRWDRIREAGLAWTSALAGAAARSNESAAALVELTCSPGHILETADAAASVSEIYSIDLTAGERDMIVTMVTPNDNDLAEFAVDRLGLLPGVRSVRTHIVHDVLRLGSDWTVQSLSPAQRIRIPPPRGPRASSAKHIPESLGRAIRQALSEDARTPFTELSDRLGISAQRISDAVARLRMDGDLILRTDVAATYSNWPVSVWFFIQAPAASLSEARLAMQEMPSVQYAAITSGPANLVVAAGAKSKSQVLGIEAELEQRLPGSRIIDRSMILRVHKHLGRLFDSSGRARNTLVPLP